MSLHTLNNNAEKFFFLNFAYLIAVADRLSDADEIPIQAQLDNPAKGEYAFEEFAPSFPMRTRDLLSLREFAQRMGIFWNPASVRMPLSLEGIKEFPISIYSEIPFEIFNPFNGIGRMHYPHLSVARLLYIVHENKENSYLRKETLTSVLYYDFYQYNVHSFPIKNINVILQEITSFAKTYAQISEYRQALLDKFSSLNGLKHRLLSRLIRNRVLRIKRDGVF